MIHAALSALRYRLIRAPMALLRGFVTIPGAISLMGIATGGATFWADFHLLPQLDVRPFSAGAAETILSTLAGAAMSALTLVYSIVLVVFTLAAGTIAPRLLERFSHDRTNQIAVGSLGALFLHALVTLALSDRAEAFFSVLVGLAMALGSVLLLLIFVDRVARRVTIDEEIAEIADELDAEFARAAKRSAGLEAEALARPDGPVADIHAPRSGYVNGIDAASLAETACACGGFIDFTVDAGDPVLKGDLIARAIGGDAPSLAKAAVAAVSIGDRRTAEDDLRFSVALLLEIALRALSPGVNDSFTAIACIDRLTASFASAAEAGVTPGVYCDKAGAARVTAPKAALSDLIPFAFAPIRRAARDNILVAEAATRALARLSPRLEGTAADAAKREAALLAEEIAASAAVRADREDFASLPRG